MQYIVVKNENFEYTILYIEDNQIDILINNVYRNIVKY